MLQDTAKEKEYIKSQVSEAAEAGRRLRRKLSMRKKALVPAVAVVKLQALARGARVRGQIKQSMGQQGTAHTSLSIRSGHAESEWMTDGPQGRYSLKEIRRSFKEITEDTEQRMGQKQPNTKGAVGVPSKRPSVTTSPQPFTLGYDRQSRPHSGPQAAGAGSSF